MSNQKELKGNTLRCFTDGAAKKNSKEASAGWAFYIPILDIRRSGHIVGTNNQAELIAIKELLTYIKNELDLSTLKFDSQPDILVFSDSNYAINVLTGCKYAQNIDLINSIFELGVDLKKYYNKIKFKHVDAHTNNTDWLSNCNDVVDKLASEAANPKKDDKKKDKKVSKKKTTKKVFEK